MPFLDLSGLKTLMRIPTVDTSRDTELQLYVDAANAHIYGVLGGLTDSVATSYTDRVTIDDSYTTAVWTRRWPVLASPAPVVTDAGAVRAAASYSLNDLGLCKLLNAGDVFTHGPEQVVLTYTAGFAPGDPALAELKLAAAQIAMFNVNTAPHAGLSKEKIGQYEYQLAAGAAGGGEGAGGFGLPASAERILSSWTAVMRGWPNAV